MIVFIFTSLILIYILSNFIPTAFFSYSIGILSIIAIFISIRKARGLYFISGICFLFTGSFLFIFSDLPWYSFFLYFESMLGVLALFLVLPFINSLIHIGRYDKNLSLLLQKGITRLSQLYRRSFILTHFLGLFLNIATLPLLKSSLDKTMQQLPKSRSDKYYAQNLLRGYALCLTWSPLEIMVITSLDITNFSYIYIFPILLTIVLLVILSDWILSYFKYRNITIVIEAKAEVSLRKIVIKIAEMLLLLLTLVLLVTVVQYMLNKGFLFSIVIVIIPFSIIWASVFRKGKRYVSIAIPTWKKRTNGLSNFFFMFLSAGLFVEMLSLTQQLYFLETMFRTLSNNMLLFYISIGGYFLFTAFMGFHPLVSLTLLSELLQPILFDVSSLSLAIVLISCSLATVMYSPYNVSVSILAEQLKLNPYKMGMWNIPFAIFYMLLSISIAYIILYI
ncbi:hypothetical protein N0O92_14720 [Alkalihalobacillus sp. MEB130]|uniref:hypothetical protein n=1 Tax=Alkalihalobacillus sp. MEB130 TaxID=2976704 RepID=UPI0028DF4AAF|nr:hypothetical protein [Alkalihalobacillus sp. MEB130]MDT8861472.1 hypothetical protein [Alkalihalobacillus sp. MEB130]